MFAVIRGDPWRNQQEQAYPELQVLDRLLVERVTVKNDRTGPFSNELGNNLNS